MAMAYDVFDAMLRTIYTRNVANVGKQFVRLFDIDGSWKPVSTVIDNGRRKEKD